MISFARIVITVFVFTKVLQKKFLILLTGNPDKYLSVSDTIVLQIALVSIKSSGLLVLAFLDQLERRYIAVTLSDIDI